jgi:asparagine synthase (glutamine-hydrolysing)
MAFSIESRVPFLTPSLASFAQSLPEEYIISPRGETKSVLRAALRGIVPDAILDRRDKIGFAVPDRKWLLRLAPWVEGILTSEAARRPGPLLASRCLDNWRRFAGSGRGFNLALWRCINFIEWARIFGVDTA